MKEKSVLFLAQYLVKGGGFAFSHVLGHRLHAATEYSLTELYLDHVSDLQVIRGLDHAGIDHYVAFAASIVGYGAALDDAGYL